MKKISKELRSKELRYYYRNREKLIKKCRDWQKNNPDKIKTSLARYANSPKGIYAQLKKNVNHRNRGVNLDISHEDFIEWHNKQEKKCVYCGIKEKDLYKIRNLHKKEIKRLTIDRVSNDRNYELGNIVLACILCNSVKSNFFTFDEMKKIGKVIKLIRRERQAMLITKDRRRE